MKTQLNRGFTLIELLVVITIIAILASFAVPVFNKVVASAQQTKQINNCKQIQAACGLYAADKYGIFPEGNYDPAQAQITPGADPSASAEACFQDLIDTKILTIEKVFWSPQNTVSCSPGKPNEDSTLVGSENCWDYISGLTNSGRGDAPLVFETYGGGWTLANGHPWDTQVVCGFVDGSAEKIQLNADGTQALISIDGERISLETGVAKYGPNAVHALAAQ